MSESEVADESPPTMPSKLGRYTLLSEIARGGMGAVYLARLHADAGIEKIVAIKVIRHDLAKEHRVVQMFLDEARIASRIGHSNVCAVFDVGIVEGSHFFAMEYLEGESLSKVLAALRARGAERRPANHARILARVLAQACEGLHAAHELTDVDGTPLAVVHRDVSPSNVFVTYDGTVKVMDFGIAWAARRVRASLSGELKGKVGYFAPEVLRGDAADRRVDVWGIGIVAWELLTGERLFRRETSAATLEAVLTEAIPAPSLIAGDVPKELDRVVVRALERSPGMRHPTARALGQELEAVVALETRAVGAAEISAWMSELFPEGREKARHRFVELVGASAQTDIRVELPAAAAGAQSPAQSTTLSALDGTTQKDAAAVVAAKRPRSRVVAGAVVAGVSAVAVLAAAIAFGLAGVGATTRRIERARADGPRAREGGMGAASSSAAATANAGPAPDLGPAVAAAPPGAGERTAAPDAAIGATAEPPGPRARFGMVSISSQGGWATVLHRGRRVGQTPLRLRLPAGPQELGLEFFGRPPARTITVHVRPGATTRVPLRPPP